MPLLIVSGFPCSGKSKRAGEISEHMTQRGIKTVIVSDQSEGVNTRTAYSTAASEKQARGVIKSAVDRSIAKDVLVIVDSLNYIKGFRYELYCIARAMQTPHCIVHTLALDSDCVERHSQLGEPYGEGNAKRLIQRFETPNPQQRWDRPTFAVTEDESLPLGDIYKCLFQPERQVKAHQATQSQPLSGTNFLYELDRITQAIVSVCNFNDYISVRLSNNDIYF